MVSADTTEARRTDLILGVPIDILTEAAALERILRLAAETAGPPAYVATVNVDFLVNTQSWWPGTARHPELLDALREAALVTADGMPVVWASRLLGGRVPERVAGSDLVPALAREAARRGLSLYLLGGAGNAAPEAGARLQEQAPGLRIAGIDSPFVHVAGSAMAASDEEDAAICRRIADSGARILLIGFGNPKQEIWFARNRHRLPVAVALGIGGTFNFLTGRVQRAPAWMQRTGLEWIYRLFAEPGRLWKRYALGFFKFGCMMLPPLAGRRRRGGGAASLLRVAGPAGTGLRLRLPAHLGGDLQAAGAEARAALDESGFLLLDARACRTVDVAGLGELMELTRACRRRDCPVLLHGVSAPLRRQLEAHRAWDWWSGDVCATPAELVTKLRLRWPEFGYFAGVEKLGTAIRFALVGELAGPAMVQVDRAIVAGGLAAHDLLLDVSACARLDNNAAGLLARLQRDLAAKGHHLTLEGVHPVLANTLRQAGLEDILRSGHAGPGGT